MDRTAFWAWLDDHIARQPPRDWSLLEAEMAKSPAFQRALRDAELDALLARLDETQKLTLAVMAMNLPALCAQSAAAIRALQSDIAQCREQFGAEAEKLRQELETSQARVASWVKAATASAQDFQAIARAIGVRDATGPELVEKAERLRHKLTWFHKDWECLGNDLAAQRVLRSNAEQTLAAIASALGTDATGPALVEAARKVGEALSDTIMEAGNQAQTIDALQAELAVERTKHSDNPELDATDCAHPAWWRGNDAGVAVLCKEIAKILDGKEPTGAAGYEPWQEIRERLWKLRQAIEQPAASPPTEAEIARVMLRLRSAGFNDDTPSINKWVVENVADWRRVTLAAYAEIQRSAAPSVPAELLARLPDRKKLILSPEQVSAVWELIAWARTLPASPLPADVVKQARAIAETAP